MVLVRFFNRWKHTFDTLQPWHHFLIIMLHFFLPLELHSLLSELQLFDSVLLPVGCWHLIFLDQINLFWNVPIKIIAFVRW